MKPFRFPLERVLEWRRGEFETEQAALRLLHAEREGTAARRRTLAESLERERRMLVSPGDVSGETLAALEAYRDWVRRETLRLEDRIRQLDRRIAEQRGRVIEAQRKVKLLERLREKALRQWTAEVNREIESFAAEAFLARWRPG
jgi:flagellar export protein FliJ